MKLIPLRARSGEIVAYAKVDDEDYDWLMQWRWHVTRRSKHHRPAAGRCEHVSWDNVTRKQKVRNVLMHQQIMGFPDCGIDHKNRDPLDNQRANLRLATQAQNQQNLSVQRRSSSGIRGVSKSGNYWKATVQVDGVQHYLGQSKDKDVAAVLVQAFRAQHMPYSEEAGGGLATVR